MMSLKLCKPGYIWINNSLDFDEVFGKYTCWRCEICGIYMLLSALDYRVIMNIWSHEGPQLCNSPGNTLHLPLESLKSADLHFKIKVYLFFSFPCSLSFGFPFLFFLFLLKWSKNNR